SMAVHDGTPNFLHYVTTKAAVIGLPRAMAREMGGDNITVNTVTRDYIPHDRSYAATQPEWLEEWMVNGRCLKREEVPEDVVGVVRFVAGVGGAAVRRRVLAVTVRGLGTRRRDGS